MPDDKNKGTGTTPASNTQPTGQSPAAGGEGAQGQSGTGGGNLLGTAMGVIKGFVSSGGGGESGKAGSAQGDAKGGESGAAKLRMEEDMPHYSDANFTMRLSYGRVGGYNIGGQPSGYYTTSESIVEKMKAGNKGVIDYQAEPIMHELMSASNYGPYADKTTGKMQLCLLTNNDITGGNSGTPLFDGQGRLIGLAFDGNWDSLASDIMFDKVLARTISVDIRFVLYLMDRWGHADHLLQEIGAK